jgi:hypothetical protein
MIEVRFMSLVGKFTTVKTEQFPTISAAIATVTTYAEAGGYSNVKLVDDGEDPDSWRVTAKTPGGRGGRNVAFLDDIGSEDY